MPSPSGSQTVDKIKPMALTDTVALAGWPHALPQSGIDLEVAQEAISRWKLRDEDARQLLGGVTNGPYYEMKKHADRRVLDPDTLVRISYLLGIFKSLNVLHSQPLADDWVSFAQPKPNLRRRYTAHLHDPRGLPAMSTVRPLLDARQVGL